MKKIIAALVSCYLLISATYGQGDSIRPPALGVSFFLNDFKTASLIRSTSLMSVLSNKTYARFRDMSPGIALTYFQGLRKHVDFAGTLEGSFLNYPMPNKSFYSNSFLLAGEATLNFKLTTEKYWVQPYAIAGIAAQKYLNYYGAFIPLGVGLKVNFFDETHFFLTAEYRVPVTTETSNYHLNYSIGWAGNLGKKKEKVIPPPPPPPPVVINYDRDGDGVPDSIDRCPDTPGLAALKGCPDRDGDGIPDIDDKCPDVPGLARYQGCPIPDTDGDGINDEEDKCPTVKGLARYQGCPIPDTDGDGINDEEDKCPTIPGVKENQGCPLIKEEVKAKVDHAAAKILFVTGSYKLDTRSSKGLDDVVKILQDNPAVKLTIDGHTDNVGKDELNQKLSDNRADAVKAYFINKGIAESRITAVGHGKTMPVADNKTAAGRQKNRRVEMKLSYY